MEQIKELNHYVRTKLAPSQIDGVGVFALRDIKKSEPLFTDIVTKLYNLPYSDFDKLRPEVAENLLQSFPLIVKGSAFAYPITRTQAFLNHSDVPNYDAGIDMALRDIKAGEEITEDYRKIEGYEQVFTFLKSNML